MTATPDPDTPLVIGDDMLDGARWETTSTLTASRDVVALGLEVVRTIAAVIIAVALVIIA